MHLGITVDEAHPPSVAVVGAGRGLGALVAHGLAARGHDVKAFAAARPRWRPPYEVHHTGPSARDLQGIDALVVMSDAASADVRAAVGEAAVDRIVCLVPLTRTDRRVPAASAVLRLGAVVGRRLDEDAVEELVALTAGLDPRGPIQVVHVDDVVRAVALGCTGALEGDVALAAPGVVSVRSLAGALGVRARGTGAAPVVTPSPEGSVVPGTCWSAIEAVGDLAMATAGTVVRRGRVRRRPGRAHFRLDLPRPDEPAADGRALAFTTRPEHRGELDHPTDPRFPAYSSVNLAEALPGPATALSLTTVAEGTAAAGTAFVDLVPVGGVLETEAWARSQAVVGHRVFVNISFAYALASVTPGMDVDAMAEQFVGRSSGDLPLTADEPVPASSGARGAGARLATAAGRRFAAMLRAHTAETDRYIAEVERLRSLTARPAELSDERLEDLARLAKDLTVVGWVVGGRNVLAVQLYGTALGRLAPESTTAQSAMPDPLASSAAVLGVRDLAAAAGRDEKAAAVLREGGPDLAARARQASPDFAALLDDALDRFGHRGPGECELANPTFADDPDLLVGAVARMLGAGNGTGVAQVAPPPPELPRAAAALVKRTHRAQAVRERARDHLVRATDILRRLALEQGRRLAAEDVLDDERDVFHLTFDELFRPPRDARQVVARRRDERSRLAALRFPHVFSGACEPRPDTAEETLRAGQSLVGAGASAGVAKGRVRIVDVDNVADVEPGDVLVAHVTDVGYTSAFSYAAAVVTDVGGVMSHAAVVAREFGVPAVVDTGMATLKLADDMIVEVDGAAGEVRVLDDGGSRT